MNHNPAQRAPRTEQERLLRGRLLGRRVELIDGRSGTLQAVWFEPSTRGLSCCVALAGGTVWIDASEVQIPGRQDGTSRGPGL